MKKYNDFVMLKNNTYFGKIQTPVVCHIVNDAMNSHHVSQFNDLTAS